VNVVTDPDTLLFRDPLQRCIGHPNQTPKVINSCRIGLVTPIWLTLARCPFSLSWGWRAMLNSSDYFFQKNIFLNKG
jgi:hypothetical protein